MRVLMTVALVVALALAGCSDKKKGDSHEHETYQCPNGGPLLEAEDFPDHDNESFELSEQCPGEDDDDDNGGNSTPNQAPVLALKVFDAPGGNETNVTMVEGSLTFSAEGSTDADGSLSGVAVTVDDSNSTRTLPLYAAGRFVPATFTFDRAGIVNVTVAAVDDRAGFTVSQSNVYVNEVFAKTSHQYPTAAPSAASDPTDCAGIDGGTAVTNTFSEPLGFTVTANASYVEVVMDLTGTTEDVGDIDYAICTPEGESIGGPFTDESPHTSENTAPLPGSVNYYVWSVGRVPGSQAIFTMTVHYEPRSAA